MKAFGTFNAFSNDYLHIINFEINFELEFMPRNGDVFLFDHLFLTIESCNYDAIEKSIFIEFETPRYIIIEERSISNWIMEEKKQFLDLGFSMIHCDLRKDKKTKIK